ncbi:MAG: phospho-N-acetylmuramoyl-pentapeptide-transferase [Phormidium sp. GEM2.Bin31]|nr:phospho-N-acetylmuramoyl-pentapeptide-transferase [Phormidium sp. BM_Day4_Bin.17]TVR09929.1 MAG: phospho-N-acetylmuramoyl-pentapeptide-transferase [Phormidium sp. GEM2.Bin31]UCJ10618.1 MAG: phospho-N-acetylmuramoyl-pentapeptide-transferase [Phormidium sp. PBR-2020]
MDTKVSRSDRRPLSGTTLSWGLALLLALGAIALDSYRGNWQTLGDSLTLPWLLTAMASAQIGRWGVPQLRQLKLKQSIRQEGPQAHLQKAGTPTMGGIFFVPLAVAIALIWGYLTPSIAGGGLAALWAVSLLTLAYGFIGWLDDWQVIRRRSNDGISPRTKLSLQIGVAFLFCAWAKLNPDFSTQTTVEFPGGWLLPLGTFFWIVAGFVLTAESNATNLTDGLDGLMAGIGAIAFLALAAMVTPAHPSLGLFCACFSGACLGFLAHNRNPAKVFMGDTGSLALGGALASVGILGNVLFGLFLLSGLLFAETLSVILQVSYYKATKNPDGVGKRLFKMTPLHHHFELSGWSELQVVSRFYGVSLILALLALWLNA